MKHRETAFSTLPKLGSWVRIPSPAPIFLLQTSMAAQSGAFAPRVVGPMFPPSLADVQRIAVLQVEMQMGAVDVVGFGAEHCGEHLAGALMHTPEELGLRQ
jgi:hypothetical protein